MAEEIGYIDCAHCNKEVMLKASKKGKAYYNCPNCGQMFFRTAAADEAARAQARPTKKGEVKNDELVQKGPGGDKAAGGKKDNGWGSW